MNKKRILIIIVLFSNAAICQTAVEWIGIKKTGSSELVKQIIAFQAYLGYLKDGYNMAKKGITAIESIKNGEWSLHTDFFGSLAVVSPSIKKYVKVADIISMQLRMMKQSKSFLNESKRLNQVSPNELAYMQKVCDHLLSECLKDIDGLVMVIISGEVKMTDGERIERIDRIYSDIQDKQVFLQSFGRSATNLSKQRRYETLEIELSAKLNGLNR